MSNKLNPKEFPFEILSPEQAKREVGKKAKGKGRLRPDRKIKGTDLSGYGEVDYGGRNTQVD